MIYAGLYSWNLIKFLIDNNFMKKSQIKKMLLPCGELPFEIFKDFVEFIYTNFQEDEAKSLINVFIGNTGSIYNKDIRGCIVDSLIEACSLQAMYQNVEIYPFTILYLVKQTIKNRLLEDNTSINRFVISGGIKKLLENMETVMNDNSKLIAIRTDCVYIENYEINDSNKFVYKDDNILNKLGKIKIE